MKLSAAELEEVEVLLDRLDAIRPDARTSETELHEQQSELIAIKARACELADKAGYTS